jgi:nucleotide-binding universal stress UspA family protein/rubrerythrin
MYQQIYVPVDNSPYSDEAAHLAARIGQATEAHLYGCHVYAAKLHDRRFRTMESGLPEEFQQERELEKQRRIHDSLITKGLELITDSYLMVMAEACRKSGLEFTGISLEGTNWKELVKDIEEHSYDLVVMGANGMGRVPESLLGSVTERVARRIHTDLLIVKDLMQDKPEGDKIVVCLDGSERSFGGLKAALELGALFGKQVEALSAFDPYFHYGMFQSLNQVLSDKARKVFKFEEQEKLHEEIIDGGLAKIYQSHLDIAGRIAKDEGVELQTRLLDGKAWKTVLAHIRKDPPWLLVLGRTGIHSSKGMDIGGNTENLLRLAPCNILMMETEFSPPVQYQAEETIGWTLEARQGMKKVPEMARGVAMKAIQQHAVAEGYTMITSGVVEKAVRALLPPQARAAMGIDITSSTSGETEASETFQLTFQCPSCQYVHHHQRPIKCPVCGEEGRGFRILDSSPLTESPQQQGITETTFDGRQLTWTPEARMRLNHVPPGDAREQLRIKLEKRAHVRHQQMITEESVQAALEEEPTEDSLSLQWSDEAVKRLSRVPEGFMRHAAQTSIEEYALEQQLECIDLDVAESGLQRAREKMQKTMEGGMKPHSEDGNEKHVSTIEDEHQTPDVFECQLCGFTEEGLSPKVCRVCQSSDFKRLSMEERRIASDAAFRILEWEDEARERVNRVPSGFMREMTRNRIEQWARKFNKSRVTLEIVEAKYNSWGEGSRSLSSRLTWTEDAKVRIERVPDFIRPMVQVEVERQALGQGMEAVDGVMLDRIMEQWGALKKFHHASSA